MPQVDKATFLSIVFWTFTLYSIGYLFLNTTVFYGLFSSLKLHCKRLASCYERGVLLRRISSALLVFPLVSL